MTWSRRAQLSISVHNEDFFFFVSLRLGFPFSSLPSLPLNGVFLLIATHPPFHLHRFPFIFQKNRRKMRRGQFGNYCRWASKNISFIFFCVVSSIVCSASYVGALSLAFLLLFVVWEGVLFSCTRLGLYSGQALVQEVEKQNKLNHSNGPGQAQWDQPNPWTSHMCVVISFNNIKQKEFGSSEYQPIVTMSGPIKACHITTGNLPCI